MESPWPTKTTSQRIIRCSPFRPSSILFILFILSVFFPFAFVPDASLPFLHQRAALAPYTSIITPSRVAIYRRSGGDLRIVPQQSFAKQLPPLPSLLASSAGSGCFYRRSSGDLRIVPQQHSPNSYRPCPCSAHNYRVRLFSLTRSGASLASSQARRAAVASTDDLVVRCGGIDERSGERNDRMAKNPPRPSHHAATSCPSHKA